MDVLDHYIVILQIRLINGFILRIRIFSGQEYLHRHERTIFLQHLSDTVLIGKLQAVVIEVEGHG